MIKKIITGISFAVAFFAALVVSSVGEVDNWWQISKPWVAVFFIFATVGVVAYNITEIRRYTYPSLVCLLAWMYEHKLIANNFSYRSHVIYRKYNSYGKLFKTTQNLYDAVMFAEV